MNRRPWVLLALIALALLVTGCVIEFYPATGTYYLH